MQPQIPIIKPLLFIILVAGWLHANAQSVRPLPENFTAQRIYTEEPGFICINGGFTQRDSLYFSRIFYVQRNSPKSASDLAGPYYSVYDSSWTIYYNQLFVYSSSGTNRSGILYSRRLNYLLRTDVNRMVLDSVPQAEGINQVRFCKDSLIYASVINKSTNFIVRKRGMDGAWETVPVVIKDPAGSNFFRRISPYLLAALIISAILLYFSFVLKGKAIEEVTNKENEVYNNLRLAADKPLDYEQITNGDTKDAIDAIVEVIKNRNTPLPMTVAINGAWGSGKSTIMNCIRQRLDVDGEKRFITTWFNAWHQQTESSLLNAFLLKIIDRYEKPFFKNNSLKAAVAFGRFRFQLASRRFAKWPFYNQILSGFAITFLLMIAVILLLNFYGYPDSVIFQHMNLPGLSFRNLLSDGTMNSLKTIGSLVAIVLSVCSFFILRSESAPTIGAFLNIIYKKSFLIDAEKNNPDMREKFRGQYWEIMEAVEDRVLIVFIDDLDRVNGDKIFEMLEAINFIGDVTSRPDVADKGSLKTVFVLGMYINQVAEQLGTFLQKENPYRDKDNPANAKAEALSLGKRYIEKMIQLNVPVPLSGKSN